MAPKKNRVKVSELKGLRLYNFLLKRLGEENAKKPKKQQLGRASRRQIVSKELYPKFKQGAKAVDVTKAVKKIVTGLPPAEICNPLYLSEAYLSFVEYYEIDNHIRTVLPDCLNVRVNAGGFGKTKIFNTNNYSYYGNGVRKIIENIRKELEDNKSGIAYFSGVVKLMRGKPNDGNPANYYVEYVLYINDTPEADDNPVDFDLPRKEVKKVEEVKDYLADRFGVLEKAKRKRKREAKKAKPKTAKEEKKIKETEIRNAINSLKRLLKAKLITKEQFEQQKASLTSLKRKP